MFLVFLVLICEHRDFCAPNIQAVRALWRAGQRSPISCRMQWAEAWLPKDATHWSLEPVKVLGHTTKNYGWDESVLLSIDFEVVQDYPGGPNTSMRSLKAGAGVEENITVWWLEKDLACHCWVMSQRAVPRSWYRLDFKFSWAFRERKTALS